MVCMIMGKVNFISELQHQLCVYFSFSPKYKGISPDANAADLIMWLHRNKPGISIRKIINDIMAKPEDEFKSRFYASNSARDYDALQFAIMEVERIERLYG